MKFARKVFLITFLLFTLCLNACIYMMAHTTYNKELNTLKERALGEAYFIASSLENDFSSLNTNNSLTTQNINYLFSNYMNYYAPRDTFLGLIQDHMLIQNNLPLQHYVTSELEKNTQYLTIKDLEKISYIYVVTPLATKGYILNYCTSIQSFQTSWHQLIIGFILTSSIVSLLLAISLYFILQHLTRPLKDLAFASNSLSNGNYDERILISGKDEFTQLALCFNNMAHKIEEKIHELSDATEKKQRLVDNLAHELRTPLTSITGYTEYMQRAALTDEQRYQSLDYILTESKRLERLSEVLLTLADLRHSNIEFTFCKAQHLITHIQTLFKEKLVQKEVTLSITSQVPELYGNPILLESLLINLIENALRASHLQGIIKLSITSDPTSDKHCIQISDNGIGIKAELLHHLAEPFYRVDKARSRKNGGVGLGLSLCLEIAHCHNGSLHFTSTYGQGTTVTLLLPKRP